MTICAVLATGFLALQLAAAQNSSRDASTPRLADIVSARLASSGSLQSSMVDVTARSGVVTLEGTVPSASARDRAIEIAKRTRGVERVEDRLRVAPAAGAKAALADTELARHVAETLVKKVFAGEANAEKDYIYGWEVSGSNFDFDVEVDDGDVTLDGEVPSPAVARRLMQATRAIPEVRSVHSMLYINEHGFGRFSSPLGYPDVPYYYWPY